MENEIWVDAIGFEHRYEVSNLGRVRSKDLISKRPNIGIIKGKIKKHNITPGGYADAMLCKNRKTYHIRVNRLVWESFNGKTDLNIDHIAEGNRLDNRLCNLQAISQRENVSKFYKTTKKTSKYTGVSWYKNMSKWRAKYCTGNKSYHIGYFDTQEEARAAYLEQRRKDAPKRAQENKSGTQLD
jgi:hypothetical protein